MSNPSDKSEELSVYCIVSGLESAGCFVGVLCLVSASGE